MCAVAGGRAHAQSAFTGVVKDTSGAVLPGVTVEAASPALIEKTRSVVTDENGAYRLVDLRPGVYFADLLAGRILDGQARRGGARIELHDEHQRRSEGRRPRRDADGHRRGAGGRRADHDEIAGPQSRGARRDSDRPHDSGHGPADYRRLLEPARHRRLEGDAADLHVGARRRLLADHRAGRRPAGERHRRRRRGAELFQQLDEPGDGLHHQRRGGRRVGRRRPAEHDSARWRQPTSAAACSSAIRTRTSRPTTSDQRSDQAAGSVRPTASASCTTSKGRSAARSAKTRSGTSPRPATSMLDTLPADTFYGDRRPRTRRPPRCRATSQGVDPQSIKSVQARVTWQISPKNKLSFYNDRLLEESRLGDDGRLRSEHRRHRLDLADLLDRLGQVHVDGHEQDFRRGRLLDQLRALQHVLPARPGEGAVHARVVHDHQQAGHRTGTQWNAGATKQGMYPDRFAAVGSVSYVTGAHNIKVGLQDTWGRYRQFRSANGDLRANFNNGVASTRRYPEHAGQVRRRPEGRRRHLRPGLVDDQPADPELRRALGVLRVGHPGGNLRHRPLRDLGPDVRADRHADLEEHRAARRRGLRPVRQPEDGAEGQLRPDTCRPARPASRTRYNPLALQTAQRRVDRSERRRRAAGRARLRLSDAGLRDEHRRQLPAGFGVANLATFAPDIKRMYNLEESRQRPARDACRRVGDRRLVPPRSTTTCAGAPTPASASPTTRRSRSSARSTAARSPTTTSARRRRTQVPRMSTRTRPIGATSTTASSTTSTCACRTASRCSAAA